MGCAVDQILNQCLVFRMNSLKDQLYSRLRLSIEFKDPKGLFRPEDFSARNTPAETSGMAESLRFGEERSTSPQFVSQMFLLSHIDRGSNHVLEFSVIENGNTDASNMTNVAVRPHDAFRNVEPRVFRKTLFYGSRHELAVFKVDERQILFDSRRFHLRIESVDLKQLTRPKIKETGWVKCPTSHMS